ncbi:uncharacterized protein [Rutidosis leptorrhynchoides]|uniref:uncharacterized protein n=1 Tax=Rutidosis leptorrhynchoides TaxID=125765 RepID=UPI003A9A32C4
MEPINSIPEISDESTTIVQEQQQNSTSAVIVSRSYECNFCKRGFTNAQALGGHMNIHRKHKAKLKESSSSLQPDVNKTSRKNKRLLLFGDESSDSRNNRQENVTKDSLLPMQEVDLELRLGHVQSPDNKITTTRKFF